MTATACVRPLAAILAASLALPARPQDSCELEAARRYEWARVHAPGEGGLLTDPPLAFRYRWSAVEVVNQEQSVPGAVGLHGLTGDVAGFLDEVLRQGKLDAPRAAVLRDLAAVARGPEALAKVPASVGHAFDLEGMCVPPQLAPSWRGAVAHEDVDRPSPPQLVVPQNLLRREDAGIRSRDEKPEVPWKPPSKDDTALRLLRKLCPAQDRVYRCGEAQRAFAAMTKARPVSADVARGASMFVGCGDGWSAIPEAQRRCFEPPPPEEEELEEGPRPPPTERVYASAAGPAPELLLVRETFTGDGCEAVQHQRDTLVRYDAGGRAIHVASRDRAPEAGGIPLLQVTLLQWDPDGRHVASGETLRVALRIDDTERVVLEALRFEAIGPRDVSPAGLARALRSASAEERHGAALLAANTRPIGPDLLAALLQAASDPDPRVRTHVAEALDRAGRPPPQVLAALGTLLRDPEERVAYAAGQAAVAFGLRARPLAADLEKCSLRPGFARGECQKALAGLSAPVEAVPGPRCAGMSNLRGLVEAIGSPGQTAAAVGAESCVAAAGPGMKALVPDLLGILRDETRDPWARARAADVLGAIGDTRPEVLSALVAVAWDVRLRGLPGESLARLGTGARAALPALVASLRPPLTEEENPENLDLRVEEAIRAIRGAPGELRSNVHFVGLKAAASSALEPQAKNRYDPWLAVDGSRETAWCEGKDGSGAGEWLMVALPGGALERRVCGVRLVPGYAKSQQAYEENARPRRLRIRSCAYPEKGAEVTLGERGAPPLPPRFDAPPIEVLLPDDVVPWVEGCVRIEVLGVADAKYPDACISEVMPLVRCP